MICLKHSIVTTILTLGTILSAEAQPSHVPSMAEGHLQAFPLKDVQLTDSWIKEREQLNTTYVTSLDADRLLHNFRVTAGIPSNAQPLGGWEAPNIGLRGHFVGHYLSTLAVLVHRYNDPTLTLRLNYMIDELSRCQEKNGKGYLSAFSEKDLDVLETRFGGVWAPYYTLHKLLQGLLDAYTLTGNHHAYDMALQMADYIDGRMSRLSPETIQRIMDTRAANPGNENGGMNEVLYQLYSLSHDNKHLKLAHLFDPEWFFVPLAQGKDILAGLHSNTHIVLVNGFFRRYQQTGEQLYWDAATNFCQMLHQGHCYVNGTSSGPRPNVVTPTSKTAEHWGEAGHLSNTLSTEIAESCVSHNTMKLLSYLFGATGNADYADKMMNLRWNAVMPIQSASTGQVVYHLPLGSPRTKKYLKPDDFYCCNGSSIEAFARLNANIYWHDDNTLWVNDYVPSIVEWKEKNLVVEQHSTFPQDDTIIFKIAKATRRQPTEIRLFIPSWAESGTITINGETTSLPTDGTPHYHSLHCTWKKGDEIRLVLQGGFQTHSLAGNDQTIAITYGPMLLAVINGGEIILPCTKEQLLNQLKVDNKTAGRFSLVTDNHTYPLKPLFDIDKETYSVYLQLKP